MTKDNPQRVIILVVGGIAEVYETPADIEVVILDYDDLGAGIPCDHCCPSPSATEEPHTLASAYVEYDGEAIALCENCWRLLQPSRLISW